MAASILNTANATFGADPWTITNANIGTADASRIVIVGAGGAANATANISGVTIGGVTATKILDLGVAGSPAALYAALVPAGTTATIVVSFTAAMAFGGVGVWAAYGTAGPTAFATGSGLTNPYNASIGVPAGGVAVGYSHNNASGGSTPTWTNLARDYTSTINANNNQSGASAAFAAQQTSINLQCSWNVVTNNFWGLFASFAPAAAWLPDFSDALKRPRLQTADTALSSSGNDFDSLRQFHPAGWEVRPPQPPHPRPERFAAIAPKEDGAEAPFVYVPPLANVPAWQFNAQEVQPPAARVWQRLAGLVPGENSGMNSQPPVVRFVDHGWPVQPPQPPALPYRKMFGALLPGDASDQNPQPSLILFSPNGWHVQEWQPPAPQGRPERRAGAIMAGDFGAYDVRRLFFQFGFENQPPQPPHRGAERKHGAVAVGDFGAWDRLRRFFDYGWFVQPPQPPHPAPERRAGGVMPIEPGVEGVYIYVAPTIIWESGEQSYGPPGRRYRQEAAIMRGVDGTDAPLIRFRPFASADLAPMIRPTRRRWFDFGDAGVEAVPIPPAWGWQARAPELRARPSRQVPADFLALTFDRFAEPSWAEDQVDLLRPRRPVVAVEMEPTYVPLPPVVGWGFDPDTDAFARRPRHVLPEVDERLLPPFPRLPWGWSGAETFGRFSRRTLPADAPQAFLPRPLAWGWDQALPDLRAKPIRRALDRGYELVTNLPLRFYDGWEVQPPQPPRPGWNRAASTMRGVDGTEFPLIVPVFRGWDPVLFYPPHPRPERAGALMLGDVWGAWGLFYYLIPSGAIASDLALYTAIAYDVGLPP